MQSRFTGPGILRLYLAGAVVLQHLDIIGLGAVAVYLFYVLSGFWITALWHQKYTHCSHPYPTFLLSRYWRLFPLYIICITMMGIVVAHFGGGLNHAMHNQFTGAWIARSLIIVSAASQFHLLPPAWSLDIEMQFYLIAPLLIWGLAGCVQKGKLVTLTAACLIYSVCTLLLIFAPGFHIGNYVAFFVLGSLINLTKWKPGRWLTTSGLAVFFIFTALLFFLPLTHAVLDTRIHMHDPVIERYHNLYSCLAVACVIPAMAYSLAQYSDPLDRSLGDFAYPLYLFHFIPITVVDHLPSLRILGGFGCILLNVFLILSGAFALYFWLDRPIDKMRRNFVNRCHS
jgi:peptidoglycan/LPS O-acetylase OafA/YrhL